MAFDGITIAEHGEKNLMKPLLAENQQNCPART